MLFNRYTKVVFGIILAIACRQFFAMCAKPRVCAAAEASTEEVLLVRRELEATAEKGDLAAFKAAFNKIPDNPLYREYPGQLSLTAIYREYPHLLNVAINYHNPPMVNNLPIVQFLVDQGAKVKVARFVHNLGLYLAAKNERQDVAAYLIKHGANINAREGCAAETLLHKAVSEQKSQMVKILVTCGINIYAQSFNGKTALDYAYCVKNEDDAKKDQTAAIIEILIHAMAQRQVIYSLLACHKFIKPDEIPHGQFPPEDIDRILKPCILAALADE